MEVGGERTAEFERARSAWTWCYLYDRTIDKSSFSTEGLADIHVSVQDLHSGREGPRCVSLDTHTSPKRGKPPQEKTSPICSHPVDPGKHRRETIRRA